MIISAMAAALSRHLSLSPSFPWSPYIKKLDILLQPTLLMAGLIYYILYKKLVIQVLAKYEIVCICIDDQTNNG